jgi:hypothetical protein
MNFRQFENRINQWPAIHFTAIVKVFYYRGEMYGRPLINSVFKLSKIHHIYLNILSIPAIVKNRREEEYEIYAVDESNNIKSQLFICFADNDKFHIPLRDGFLLSR